MKLHSSIAMTVAGAAFLAVAAAPPAFAKKNQSAGSYSIGCLSNDATLYEAEGSPVDAQKNPLPPVTVSVSPGTLWPPNHKMESESMSANLAADFTSTGAQTYPNGADITVWVVNLTDDQTDLDGAGGHSCGQPTVKQGPDWLPDVMASTSSPPVDNSASYLDASVTLTGTAETALSLLDSSDSPATISLRRERCAKEGSRTYYISVVCCDTTFANTTGTVCDDADFASAPPPPTAAPTPTETLEVTVAHDHGHRHHGKP